MRVGTFPVPWGVQTSTERSEVGANTPLLRSSGQTPLWRLSACAGEVYFIRISSFFHCNRGIDMSTLALAITFSISSNNTLTYCFLLCMPYNILHSYNSYLIPFSTIIRNETTKIYEERMFRLYKVDKL